MGGERRGWGVCLGILSSLQGDRDGVAQLGGGVQQSLVLNLREVTACCSGRKDLHSRSEQILWAISVSGQRPPVGISGLQKAYTERTASAHKWMPLPPSFSLDSSLCPLTPQPHPCLQEQANDCQRMGR